MEHSWTEIPTPILPNYPPRRSTDYSAARNPISDDDILTPEDYTDVFGGAPRTILSHHFSSRGFLYDNIFRQPAVTRGRNLPQFRIPSAKQSRHRQNLCHGDVFGWEADDQRVVRTSRSRSKASSSSALSSEELSPLRPVISDDGYDDVSVFASKLRPINVGPRWGSANGNPERGQKITISDFLESLKKNPFRVSRRTEFGESKDVETSCSEFPDDLQFNSPASAVSSLSQSDKDIETCDQIDDPILQDDDDEDELMSSYVIEINPRYTESKSESNGVDEAIAWVKEKIQTQSSVDKPTIHEHPIGHLTKEINTDHTFDHGTNKTQEELQLLDEKIRLWSTGKESDIRLLLSSLHHILWLDSGWIAIPLTNLIETPQVKKAYQKAVLCLHPDKLQQRGATPPQKHIAHKAFSALQDAWAAFISMDGLCSWKNKR